MMEQLVSSVGGVAGFGVISICLFVVVFSGALVWALCQKKSVLEEMESCALREDEIVSRPGRGGEKLHE